jgi:phosphohistidine phosphatase
MNVYFLRHARAEKRGKKVYPNDDRPLTQDGVLDFQKSLRGFRLLVPEIDLILTSPMKRAHDTAAMVAEAMLLQDKMAVVDALLPGRPYAEVLELLTEHRRAQNIVLVGHETGLSEYACRLLKTEHRGFELKKGGVCCIEVEKGPPLWDSRLLWLVTPRILKSMKKS